MIRLAMLLALVCLPGCGFLKENPAVVEAAVQTGGSIFGSITGLQPAIFETVAFTILGMFGIKKTNAMAKARAAKKNGEATKK